MPVTLENRTRRMQVFHVTHDVWCRERCSCVEVTVVTTVENARTGERAPQRVTRKVPRSISFLARERKSDLPSAILELAEVKAAIGRGELRVLQQSADAPAPGPAAVSPTPSLAATAPAHASAPSVSPSALPSKPAAIADQPAKVP